MKYIRANLNIATIDEPKMYNVIPFTYKGIKMFARKRGRNYIISEFYSGWKLLHDTHTSIKECIDSIEQEAKIKNKTLNVKFINRRRKECDAITINKRFKKIWEANNEKIFG